MKIEDVFPHKLDLETLRARIDARVESWAARYPSLDLAKHYRWVDPREARGSYRGGEGVMRIGDTEVRVSLTLPFFARPFRARIEDFLRREAELILESPPAR